jgi:MoaA/NifB/PqqE/SkfB family radical SAM enzyme
MEPVRRKIVTSGQKIEVGFEDLESLIKSHIDMGMNSITLTGGEPTLRPDFWRLLEIVSAADLAVTVQTNGRLLALETARQHLAALSRRDILFVVALHGPDAKIHDFITRAPGSFEDTVNGLRNLMQLGHHVCGKLVISSYNLDHTYLTLDLMGRLGLEEVLVAFPHADGFSLPELRDVLPRYDKVREILADLVGRPSPVKRLDWEAIPFCVFPTTDFFPFSVDVNYLRQKLANETTIIEMSMTGQSLDWDVSRRKIKIKPPQCRTCLMDLVCEGVWAEYLDLYDVEDLLPIEDSSVVEAFLEKLS